MKNIAILASGSGTNAENIARFFHEGNRIRVALVLTNRRNAGVIERMKPLGVPVEYVPNSVWDNDPQQVVAILRAHRIDLVVLAGFMHYVSPEILDAFPSAVVNIHPSLLPAYGGKGMWGHHVHQAVMAAGEKESGVTVHRVTPEFDKGEIIMQQRVPIVEGDTPETLEERIHKAEYELYPRAIVAALETLPEKTGNDGESRPTPPPMPKSVDEEWAEVLKVKYEPEKTAGAVPPPVPRENANPAPEQRMERQAYAAAGNMPASATAAASAPETEPMPSTYLLWAVLATIFCCFVPGIAAIIFSSQVSTRYFAGDTEGARRASRNAEIWIIISFVCGVLSASFYLPFMLFS